MVKQYRSWILVLALLSMCVRPSPGAPVSAEAPVDFEALAGNVGRAEAWYWLNGYTLSPPEAAEAPLRRSLPSLSAQSLVTTVLTPTAYLPLVVNNFPLMVERRAIWVTRYDWTSLGAGAQPVCIKLG